MAGRPSLYDPEAHDRIVHEMALLGATDEELARALGISIRTLYNWKGEFPAFVQAIKEGKDIADAKVEKSLFQRATGYEHPETHVAVWQGEVIKTELIKRYPPDSTAMIFWLKNRKPAEWRDKIQTELSGGVNVNDITHLSMEEKIRLLRESASS